MTKKLLSLSAALALVAGCATESPEATAEQQCRNLVNETNVEFIRFEKTTAMAGGFDVQVRMKDGLAREFSGTCRYADGKKGWAQPLPNFAPLYLRGGGAAR